MAAQTNLMTEDDGPVGSGDARQGSALDPDLQTLQSPPDPHPSNRQPRSRPNSPPETEFVAVDDADLAALQPQPDAPARASEEGDREAPLQEDRRTLVEQQQEDKRRGNEPKNERRARQLRAKEHRSQELDFLRRRVSELEELFEGNIQPRLVQHDQQQTQAQIAQLERDINGQAHAAHDARRRLAEAVTNADTEALNRALEDRDRAIMAGQQLTVQRNLLRSGDPLGRGQAQQQQQQQQLPRQQQQQRLPAAVQSRIDEFAADHPWYNPHDPRSTDSRIVLQLDNAVAAEGFLPDTDEYWGELRRRAEKYLPWRFEDEDDAPAARNGARETPRTNGNGANGSNGNGGARQAQQQPAPQLRGPAIGGLADRGPQLKPNQVYISPERKQAMILAGALDVDGRTVMNQERYKGYLKQYANYDRANGGAR